MSSNIYRGKKETHKKMRKNKRNRVGGEKKEWIKITKKKEENLF